MASAGRLDRLEVEDELQLLHSPEGCALDPTHPVQRYDTQGSSDAACAPGVLVPSKVPSQLEVTPITMYTTGYSEALGSNIAVNKQYLCYGLSAGQIRVLERNSVARSLLKGHSKAVADSAFFSEEENLLASVALDLSLLVWRISVNPDSHTPEGERLLAVQLQPEGVAAPPANATNRVCWHPTNQNVLAYGGPAGACLLTISEVEAARQEAMAQEGASEPAYKLKLAIDTAAGAPPRGVTFLPLPPDVTLAAVADVSFSPDGLRVVAALFGGQVCVWDLPGCARPLVLRPHGGDPVHAARFLSVAGLEAPALLTGGRHNAELKLWAPLEGGDEASAGWACAHQVSLVAGGDDTGAGEAFFNHVLVVQSDGYCLLVLPNTRKNAVYTFSVVAADASCANSSLPHASHQADGQLGASNGLDGPSYSTTGGASPSSSPPPPGASVLSSSSANAAFPAARFEYLAEFAVVLPILSGAALPVTRPTAIAGADGSGQLAAVTGPVEPLVQLFCVQTTAVQQYALFVTQCVPERRARLLLAAATATHEQTLELAAAEEQERQAAAKVPKSAAVTPNRSYTMAATSTEAAALLNAMSAAGGLSEAEAPVKTGPHLAPPIAGAAAAVTPPPAQRPPTPAMSTTTTPAAGRAHAVTAAVGPAESPAPAAPANTPTPTLSTPTAVMAPGMPTTLAALTTPTVPTTPTATGATSTPASAEKKQPASDRAYQGGGGDRSHHPPVPAHADSILATAAATAATSSPSPSPVIAPHPPSPGAPALLTPQQILQQVHGAAASSFLPHAGSNASSSSNASHPAASSHAAGASSVHAGSVSALGNGAAAASPHVAGASPQPASAGAAPAITGTPALPHVTDSLAVPAKRAGLLHLGKPPPGFHAPGALSASSSGTALPSGTAPAATVSAPTTGAVAAATVATALPASGTVPAPSGTAPTEVAAPKDKTKAGPGPGGKNRGQAPTASSSQAAAPAAPESARADANGASTQGAMFAAVPPSMAPSPPPLLMMADDAAATKGGEIRKSAAVAVAGFSQAEEEGGASATMSAAELEALLSRPLPFAGAAASAPSDVTVAATSSGLRADEASSALLSLLRGAATEARGEGSGAVTEAAPAGAGAPELKAAKGRAPEAAEKLFLDAGAGIGLGGDGGQSNGGSREAVSFACEHEEPLGDRALGGQPPASMRSRVSSAESQGAVTEAEEPVMPHAALNPQEGSDGEAMGLGVSASASASQQEAKPGRAAAAVSGGDLHNKVTQALLAHMASMEREMLAIRKELANQTAAQKVAASTTSTVLISAMARDAKKLELAIGTRMDKALKGYLDAHVAAVEDTLARRDKAEAERHDKLMAAVTNTWPQEVPPIIHKAVKKELGALVLGLNKGITPSLQATVTKAVEASLAKSLTKSLPAQVDKALAPQLDATLQRLLAPADISAALQSPLMDAVRQQFASSLLPAVEASCRELFGQLDATLARGLDEHLGFYRAERAAATGALDTALRDAQAVAAQLVGEMRDLQREILAAAMEAIQAQAPRGDGAGAGGGAPDAAGSAKMLSLEHLESRLDPTIELRRLLDEHCFEEAFNRALTLADLGVVTWVCRQVDVSQLLGGDSPGLSQGVLLSLIAQLATDVVSDTGMKLEWVREAAMALDVADPLYAPHLRPILESVHKGIAQQAASVAPEWRSQVKLVLHIMTSLLAQVA